MRFPICDQ